MIPPIALTSCQLRLLCILPRFNFSRPLPRRRGTPTHLLIVLGSGGHTAEMFSLLHDLDPYSYRHRSYVVSVGDSFSALKAQDFEKSLSQRSASQTVGTYTIHLVPRARNIHQPLFATPLPALRCLFSCLTLQRTPPRHDVLATPDQILLNGPGTALIVVLASLVLRFCALHRGQRRTRSIYIESWARVRRLSLSGRILAGLGAVDRVLVQWEPLKVKSGAEWMGWMVR